MNNFTKASRGAKFLVKMGPKSDESVNALLK